MANANNDNNSIDEIDTPKETAAQRAMKAIAATQATASTAAPLAQVSQASPSSQASGEKKLSPKHKASRGVDPNLVTTWVPFDQTKEMHATIQNAAKTRGVNVPDMLAKLLVAGVEAVRGELESDAAKYEPKVKGVSLDDKLNKMSEDELEQFANKQQKIMDDLLAKIAAAKAK